MVVLLMMTTALALRESLALESGVGTLNIIHNLHLVYIQNNEEKTAFYTPLHSWPSGFIVVRKKKNQVVRNNSVSVMSYYTEGKWKIIKKGTSLCFWICTNSVLLLKRQVWFHLIWQACSTADLKIAEHAPEWASNTILHYSRQWKAINKSVVVKNKSGLFTDPCSKRKRMKE